MDFLDHFPNTVRSFNPFREDFRHGSDCPWEYKQGPSCKGRIHCLLMLAVSPASILLKIARKVFRLCQAIFELLAALTRVGKDGFLSRLGNRAIHVVDCMASLICSPLNILVGRMRFLLGLIHPGVVFTSSNPLHSLPLLRSL